jgi:hypothetical protein
MSLNKPNYVKVDGKTLKINTDFRVAMECDEIARNKSIGDFERALAIVYKLFGEEGLNCYNQNKLVKLSMRYITLGKQQKTVKTNSRNKYELDLNKCKGLISSSFKFDYKYDPYEMEYLHWYDFYNDLENLSTSEFGNCCILNRIVSVLNYDTSKIKDTSERTKMNEAKEELRKKYCINEETEMTEKQKESAKEFYKALGIDI